MGFKKDISLERSELPRNRLTIKETSVLANLPAHVWVQGQDNTVIYSNRFYPEQNAEILPQHCYECFMKQKAPCSCCKADNIRSTLCPERCTCARNSNLYNVYHFPFLANNSIEVVKFEVDLTDINTIQRKRMTPDGPENIDSEIKIQSDFLTICSSCKKIRDHSSGKWIRMENYISDHFGAEFSHGICQSCATKLYADLYRNHSDEEPKNH